jgi:predicted DCC family thiol-disulfide oxidoreductase YuxK
MTSTGRESWRPGTLVYDRDCELCRWAQGRLSAWDRGGRISYLSFQDPQFRRWFPEADGEGPPQSVFFIDEDRHLWMGVDAFRRMLPYLPWGKPLAVFFYLPGSAWISRRVYEWIARNRYRFRVRPASPDSRHRA